MPTSPLAPASTLYPDPLDPLDALSSEELEEQAFGPERPPPGRRGWTPRLRPTALVAPASERLIVLGAAVLLVLAGALYLTAGRPGGEAGETATVYEEVIVLEAE